MTVKNHEGSDPMSFTYNAFGQIVTMLQGAVLSTYTYDADGGMTVQNVGGTLTTNTYDDAQHLTNVNADGSLSTYTYSGTGLRRSAHESGGDLTIVAEEGSDPVKMSYDDENQMVTRKNGAFILYMGSPKVQEYLNVRRRFVDRQ